MNAIERTKMLRELTLIRRELKDRSCQRIREASLNVWQVKRLEVSKAKPALEFKYGEGEESVRRSPSEDLKIRRAGGTPIKLARQRVIARCIRELFKELSAIAIDTTDNE
jgi:hypothetical protein